MTRSGTTRYLLPDGSLSREPLGTQQQAQETLFREAEFGLSHYTEDYDEDHLVMQTARQRWMGILDPLTVQSLAMDPAPVDKAIKVLTSRAGGLLSLPVMHPRRRCPLANSQQL